MHGERRTKMMLSRGGGERTDPDGQHPHPKQVYAGGGKILLFANNRVERTPECDRLEHERCFWLQTESAPALLSQPHCLLSLWPMVCEMSQTHSSSYIFWWSRARTTQRRAVHREGSLNLALGLYLIAVPSRSIASTFRSRLNVPKSALCFM